jgi:hypothetical protein
MPGKTRYKKNIIHGKKGVITVYATPKFSTAIQELIADMTLYKGVRLYEILEIVYKQGKKDGARDAFDATEKKLLEAQKEIPHKPPGRPKNR